MTDYEIKCDKANCNFYDFTMTHNCAWGNDGHSAVMCMTHNYKRYAQRPLTSKSGYPKINNYDLWIDDIINNRKRILIIKIMIFNLFFWINGFLTAYLIWGVIK